MKLQVKIGTGPLTVIERPKPLEIGDCFEHLYSASGKRYNVRVTHISGQGNDAVYFAEWQ